VIATTVTRADVPISLVGFGTVQAFNSVLVKSRVDGQILKINFSEGNEIKAGDVLVEIDPAPFEASSRCLQSPFRKSARSCRTAKSQ
jgi:multidrug efflux system membrane fusion protein